MQVKVNGVFARLPRLLSLSVESFYRHNLRVLKLPEATREKLREKKVRGSASAEEAIASIKACGISRSPFLSHVHEPFHDPARSASGLRHLYPAWKEDRPTAGPEGRRNTRANEDTWRPNPREENRTGRYRGARFVKLIVCGFSSMPAPVRPQSYHSMASASSRLQSRRESRS